VDGLVDQDSIGGRADLAGVREDPGRDPLSCSLEIRVGEDDRRVLSAEFEGDGRDRFGGRFHDVLAGRHAPGECNLIDVLVFGQRLPGGVAEAGNDVNDAVGDARFGAEFGQPE